MEYKEAYYFLFNSISDLITKLEEIQKQAEKIIIEIEEENTKQLIIENG